MFIWGGRELHPLYVDTSIFDQIVPLTYVAAKHTKKGLRRRYEPDNKPAYVQLLQPRTI